MINTTRGSRTHRAPSPPLLLTLTFIFCGLITPYASAGTITLISAPTGDFGERRCTVDIPPAGAGKTLKLSVAERGGLGVGNCYDIKPSDILMQDIPSSAEILLTDDWLCDTKLDDTFYTEDDPEDNKSFVIRLETTRNPSQLPEIGIDRLAEFEVGKYIDYTNDAGEKPVGFKVVEKTHNGSGRINRKLSCLEISISDDSNTPELIAVPLGEISTSGNIEESGSSFNCSATQVMIGRKHEGDENGDTTYTCQTVNGNGTEKILFNEDYSSPKMSECGRRKPGSLTDEQPDKNCTEAVTYNKDQVDPIYFTCPTDSVMVGRDHEGDETGYTTYRCATLYKDKEVEANKLVVVPGEWEGSAKEPESDFTCGIGKVMIGRAHKSDENGPTKYRCGQLFYPTNPTTQVTP
ncbi:hypothetical protein [Pseudomonas putida]|uniref:hypothetical protein n=1 Tax=Pseudomonas putida TaxID=303 RepID=UPI000AC9224A|nr:hypothetical protein [Pseudomonas putida]